MPDLVSYRLFLAWVGTHRAPPTTWGCGRGAADCFAPAEAQLGVPGRPRMFCAEDFLVACIRSVALQRANRAPRAVRPTRGGAQEAPAAPFHVCPLADGAPKAGAAATFYSVRCVRAASGTRALSLRPMHAALSARPTRRPCICTAFDAKGLPRP